MLAFVHTADIHLDSPLVKLDHYEGAPVEELRGATRRALENLVELALAERAAFVLISGDLYDADWKDYNTGLFFISQMARLREAGIRVFIVAGNHDAASRMTRVLRLPEGVRLFGAEEPETVLMEESRIAIHGQSFKTQAVFSDLSASYPPPVPGYFNIGMLHTCAAGRDGHEPYAPCSIEALRAKGYDYWALGHVHQREILCEDPPIVFPGNIQGRHIREAGAKGCMLVRVHEGGQTELSFRTLDVIRWELCRVDLSDRETCHEAIDLVQTQVERLMEQNGELPLVARLELMGECPVHAELAADLERWVSEIRSSAVYAGNGRVWIEGVKLKTTAPVRAEGAEPPDGPMGELISLLDEIGSDPVKLRELAGCLDDLWGRLPRELKEGDEPSGPDDPRWLSALFDQVRPMLLRRLVSKREAP